ncbi:MAG: GNAT family N-acetyltransferase [Deltaproteobacteria bacterium]|jgi:CelD/BcsL family acetyltransferase involved in cellulose biosynthesis|nr:GNAT family N-acetyltransferase [Deltaproteobacteria bacterium]NOQ87148.1 GNAT family N-acetyltransferase [Deltaproteobacteria bacterium]
MNTALKEVKMESDNNLIVTEYHDPSAFDMLSQPWNQLITLTSVNTPFLTWQWQKLWWKYWNQGRYLRIITLSEESGRLCGIAPLYSEETREGQKLNLLGSSDFCDYLDFIVTKGEEAHFYHTLLSYLTSSCTEKTTLFLNSLQQNSPTLSFFKRIAHSNDYNIDINLEDKAPSLHLPSSFDLYLKRLTPKNRHEIRRKMRRVEGRAKTTFEKIDHPSKVMQKMPHFMKLFRKSAEKKNHFLNELREKFFMALADEFSRMGWLEIFTLSFDEMEVAYLFCFNYQDTLYLYNSAYDPTFYNFSPGIVTITYCLEDAINRGIKRFDFLRGNESYKYHFGAQDHNLYTLTLCLPGERNLCTE